MMSADYAALGRGCLEEGDDDNAESLFKSAIDEDPTCFEATLNLGVLAGRRGNWRSALALAERAARLRPGDPSAWSNVATNLMNLQRYDEALAAVERASELDLNHISVPHNMGLIYYNLGRPVLAEECLRRAVERYEAAGLPTAWARSDLSMAVLKQGRLKDGLELNEVRWEGLLTKLTPWELGLKRWDGEPLRDRSILVHSEQGYGDAIQFVRFLPHLVATGARVTFAAPTALVTLLRDQVGQCYEVVDIWSVGDLVRAGRASDWHSPLVSVVRALGVEYEDLSAPLPYLSPVVNHVRGRPPLAVRGAGFKVGLVWAASAGYQRSRERSLPLGDLVSSLGSVPGVKLYALQHGAGREQVAAVAEVVTDLGGLINDFADTSVLMSQMDLVITVDSGPAHLAGALGVKTWLLQSLVPCWRWARGARAWYSGVDEYFQEQAGSWDEPLAQVKSDLEEIIRRVS